MLSHLSPHPHSPHHDPAPTQPSCFPHPPTTSNLCWHSTRVAHAALFPQNPGEQQQPHAACTAIRANQLHPAQCRLLRYQLANSCFFFYPSIGRREGRTKQPSGGSYLIN